MMNLEFIYEKFLELENLKNISQISTNYSRIDLNITSIQAKLLQELIKTINPQSILEFGTSNGYSLLAMISSLLSKPDFKDKTFTSIEVDETQYNKAKEMFDSISNSFNENQIQLHFGNIFNKELLQKISSKKYDVIFVDCNQSEYQKVLEHIEEYSLLYKNGYIIFENCISHEKSYDFYTYIEKNYSTKYSSTLYPMHNGLLVIQQLN